jgi:cell wall-associated NlpC family hydrolase
MSKIYFVLIICGIFLSGCSATSSRYVRKSDTSETKSDSRYSKNQQKSDPDSVYYDDLSEENDEELEPAPDDESIDLSEVMTRFSSKKNDNVTVENNSIRENTLMEIIKYLNTPYKFGGNSKKGIDCSAFTQTIYGNVCDFQLNRSAREQFTQGIAVDKTELQFGDLVFFNTRRRVRPGHVGIYIGDNLFAHASSKHGVIVSSLDHQYYTKTYMGARRMDEKLF